MACTWASSSVSTRAFIPSVSTALVGRQGLPQPLGLPVVLGPAAHSMLAWLRCPPCSAMNIFSTTSVDWTPPPREPSKSPAAPASGRRSGRVNGVDLGRRYLVHSCVCDGLVFCIGFIWGDRRAAKELAQRKLPAGEAPDRTPVVQQSLGAPDFGGIAKLAEAIQKVTLAGQLPIGAVVFAAIAAVLGGVGSVTGH